MKAEPGGAYFHVTVGPSIELLKALAAGGKIVSVSRSQAKGKP